MMVRNKSRRGQFEILGLAILVVIIIIGILIFMALPERSRDTPLASYENEQLAQSVVDTMLRTEAGPACANQPTATLYDLIRDITIVKRGICDGTVDTSLAVFSEASDVIIMSATGFKSDFRVRLLESDETVHERVECPSGGRVQRERIGEQRIRLLPSSETVVIELQLCPGA
jgi:hypothetical protein